MKRYKVTTEVTFTIRADCEDDAIEEADNAVTIMASASLNDCEPSCYYEVEEVAD